MHRCRDLAPLSEVVSSPRSSWSTPQPPRRKLQEAELHVRFPFLKLRKARRSPRCATFSRGDDRNSFQQDRVRCKWPFIYAGVIDAWVGDEHAQQEQLVNLGMSSGKT